MQSFIGNVQPIRTNNFNNGPIVFRTFFLTGRASCKDFSPFATLVVEIVLPLDSRFLRCTKVFMVVFEVSAEFAVETLVIVLVADYYSLNFQLCSWILHPVTAASRTYLCLCGTK